MTAQILTRQQKRHRERQLIRKSMSKAERQVWVRMPKPLKREIYDETLRMIVDQFMNSTQQR